MKRILAMLLCGAMLLSCAACGSSNSELEPEPDPVQTEDQGGGEEEPSLEGYGGPSYGGYIRDFNYSLSGDYELKQRSDSRLELNDFDLGVGVKFHDDLEYSNDVITGAILLSDQNNSFQTIRGVTDEVRDINNYYTNDEMMDEFFQEYALGDFELLYGESPIYYDYDYAMVEGSALSRIMGSISSNSYDLRISGTFHNSTYVNGMTGYVLKFTYCPVDGEVQSGIWDRSGLDTYASERKEPFGISSKNRIVRDHDYAVVGNYDIQEKDNLWNFSDSNKRVGLKFPGGMEFSNALISDAVLVSDMRNGYVVARNMTSEYLDYPSSDEEFHFYLLENYLLEDFSELYEPAEALGAIRFKYYDADSGILCTGESRVQSENYDINVRTDLFIKETNDGRSYTVLTRYSPYGAIGYEEVRDTVRAIQMSPYKG